MENTGSVEKKLEDIVAEWASLARMDGSKYAKLLATPDLDAEARFYQYTGRALRAGVGRLIAYHVFGKRKCITVASPSGAAWSNALWLSLALEVLGEDYCGSWLETPSSTGWLHSPPIAMAKGLGEVVAVAPPSELGVAKYSLHIPVVDEAKLYNYSSRTLGYVFRAMGVAEPLKIAVYEPGYEETLLLLELLSSTGGAEIVFIVEKGKSYTPSLPLSVEEVVEAYRRGYSVIDLDVKLGEPRGNRVRETIAVGPPNAIPSNWKGIVVTPPWHPPLNHSKSVSWILYGAGWAYGVLEALKGISWDSLEESITDVIDFWEYELAEKNYSPSDAAGIVAVARLISILGDIIQASAPREE